MTRQDAGAWRSGATAYKNGKPVEANPYRRDSDQWLTWRSAWTTRQWLAAPTKETPDGQA